MQQSLQWEKNHLSLYLYFRNVKILMEWYDIESADVLLWILFCLLKYV